MFAELRECNFHATNCQISNFVGADLTDADFTEADLQQTDLTDAKLVGARFNGANINGSLGANGKQFGFKRKPVIASKKSWWKVWSRAAM